MKSSSINQSQFTEIFCSKPQNFAWFLGAGTSRSSGLPTATDVIWDLKRRYYCQQENQDISRQDIQNEAVKARIQSFMDAKGFPPLWAEEEYSTYFEKIFGDDKERQRNYLKAFLSEERLSLSVGNRVLGALLSSELSRVIFTTNFDSVIEKALAEVGDQSISAYHLEGSHAANQALNNEEFPLYCKLHGDFRYDSLKNLSTDLATQNEELSKCLVNAANRYGFIVTGYSGRDKSVMQLFHRVLDTENPFPHGLYWTGIKGSEINPLVDDLLSKAHEKNINAEYVEIETFDALMLRLWRNIENKPEELDKKVRKSQLTSVNIEMPSAGNRKPLIRLNALPILSIPEKCQSLGFKQPKEWSDLRKASFDTEHNLIFTKSDTVWCWGKGDYLKTTFNAELTSIDSRDIPTNIQAPNNLFVKGFLEEALCIALARDKPLLSRIRYKKSYLIVDPHAIDIGNIEPLSDITGNTDGELKDLIFQTTPDADEQQVGWAESVRISIDQKDDKYWLLLEPDLWIWPPQARKLARDFIDKRRSDRFNNKYNEILDAWVKIIIGTEERNTTVTVSAFDDGTDIENPKFEIGSRTAFSRGANS